MSEHAAYHDLILSTISGETDIRQYRVRPILSSNSWCANRYYRQLLGTYADRPDIVEQYRSALRKPILQGLVGAIMGKTDIGVKPCFS